MCSTCPRTGSMCSTVEPGSQDMLHGFYSGQTVAPVPSTLGSSLDSADPRMTGAVTRSGMLRGGVGGGEWREERKS